MTFDNSTCQVHRCRNYFYNYIGTKKISPVLWNIAVVESPVVNTEEVILETSVFSRGFKINFDEE